MKQSRDAAALAAALTTAAAKPVPLPTPANLSVAPSPAAEPEPQPAPEKPAARSRPGKAKPAASDTVGITLRPERALLTRYTLEAAERTRAAGKVISAQQIMIEVLERGLKVKS